jgi:hypothetical protein
MRRAYARRGCRNDRTAMCDGAVAVQCCGNAAIEIPPGFHGRNGSMLLKNDLRGPYAQLRFKRRVAYAISIQTTACPDSIVAHSVFVADFFNSIGQTVPLPLLALASALGCFADKRGDAEAADFMSRGRLSAMAREAIGRRQGSCSRSPM